MTLSPHAAELLRVVNEAPALDFATVTAAEFRRAFRPPAGEPGPELARVEDVTVAESGLRLRLYYPTLDRALPITLFVHGGGFVIGDIELTDAVCRRLALASGSLVASVEYRLAPETPYPGGLHDAERALRWLAQNADSLGGDAGRIAVAGDSSGANFAAVLAQRSRHTGPQVCHQLLIYPVLDHRCDTESYVRYADGYLLTADLMRWYWRQYLPAQSDGEHADAVPARAVDLQGVPEATIFLAEYDVLRSEGQQYAARLAEAGVDVHVVHWPGQIHGFLLQQGVNPQADRAIEQAGQSLASAFARAAQR